MSNNCCCVIGLSHEYCDEPHPEMVVSDLLSNGDYALKLTDFRNCCMTRFLFCPYCGAAINWKEIRIKAKGISHK